MSQSSKGIGTGETNSQYGTRWVYHIGLAESKKINKEDEIPDGWLLGRRMFR